MYGKSYPRFAPNSLACPASCAPWLERSPQEKTHALVLRAASASLELNAAHNPLSFGLAGAWCPWLSLALGSEQLDGDCHSSRVLNAHQSQRCKPQEAGAKSCGA